MSAPRIRLQIQPTVSHYREPLVRRLQQTSSFALKLVGRFKNAESTEAERIRSASEETLRAVQPLETLSAGGLWWEKGQVAAVWRGGFDAFVLEGRIHTVSTWVAAAAGRIRGRRVLLWGHGWKRPEDGLKRRLRLPFYHLVDGVMVYGEKAKELGVSYGVAESKIQVVYNSLYSEEQLPEQPLQAQDLEGRDPDDQATDERPTLVYSSRLTTRHRLDTLAEALRDWPQQHMRPRVMIVGDGAERARLERVFADSGVDAQFLGAVYDLAVLKELYAGADLALSIGGAGLNVIQALGFGVPVVAEAGHRDSSPEVEAVIEGQTGRYYQVGSAASLRAVLLETLDAPQQIEHMGQAGLDLVRRRYTAERHAAAIEAALHHFLAD
ncbi:glycosyltransferase family 4 protein [Garicola koreensis]|uniref:D-inositol 3-phosphate glycosyltransferase n=1 Tax=Garicola koreensis TaxID=1262554 RepID=A0A7W5XYT1_9MICC|nr:glycosyltransferase family 4 protein [Garicola koreensis]MBB3666816.1 glycosyltransferase involved in cell wall biosynthesis [Garicola koreensis]